MTNFRGIYWEVERDTLIAIPLFVFMGTILEKSEVAENVYQSLYELFGPVRGGLAFATIITCTIFASCTGVIAATVTTMTLLAVPSMLKRKYNKGLATGCVCAGGSLGILIPPSNGFIIYGLITSQSVGRLFLAGILPGIILTTVFIIAIYFIFSALGDIKTLNYQLFDMNLHGFRKKYFRGFMHKLISVIFVIGGAIVLGINLSIVPIAPVFMVTGLPITIIIMVTGVILFIVGSTLEMRAWENLRIYFMTDTSFFSNLYDRN